MITLAEYIVDYKLKIEAYPNIVYVRRGTMEVGKKYVNFESRVAALEAAVQEALDLTAA